MKLYLSQHTPRVLINPHKRLLILAFGHHKFYHFQYRLFYSVTQCTGDIGQGLNTLIVSNGLIIFFPNHRNIREMCNSNFQV